MKTIQLNGAARRVAIVDDEDFEALSRHRWYSISGKYCYAVRSQRASEGGKMLYMHREILGAPKGVDVDHINKDCLDNRRCNLRLATRSQNLANGTPSTQRKVSRFRGVLRKGSRRWYAEVSVRGTRTRSGPFSTDEQAAIARDAMAREAYGEFATLNFPEEAA